MANKSHIRILRQGVKAWNQWISSDRNKKPDLSHADLRGLDLAGADFRETNLFSADLRGTNLYKASFLGCNLNSSDLSRSDLTYGILWGSTFREAALRAANLTYASLWSAEFIQTNLDGTELAGARMAFTIIARTDLSKAKNLKKVTHLAPSTIGLDTIYLSKGKIPEGFLRNCGVPKDFITYARSLVIKPIEYYSCFISYSSKDNDFANRLHADLQAKHIRCWYAPEDLRIGEKFKTTIEESIRVYDKVMVVLSENSIQSAWVEEEVEAALERERQHPGSLVLFPIRLDDAVMETKQAWAASLRRIRHIGDFSKRKNHNSYQKAFERLLRDLKSQTKVASAK